jgi:hypothetical protein
MPALSTSHERTLFTVFSPLKLKRYNRAEVKQARRGPGSQLDVRLFLYQSGKLTRNCDRMKKQAQFAEHGRAEI